MCCTLLVGWIAVYHVCNGAIDIAMSKRHGAWLQCCWGEQFNKHIIASPWQDVKMH